MTNQLMFQSFKSVSMCLESFGNDYDGGQLPLVIEVEKIQNTELNIRSCCFKFGING